MKVVSLFSGCGGGDLGLLGGFNYIDSYYEKLPFSIELAVDNDTKALNTYNENFNSKHIVNKDIRNLKTEDLPNDYDILLGGFPCQSFSTVNPTKDPFDERGVLYKEMLRLLKSTQPKFFIAENVKGFMTLKKAVSLKDFAEN
ncbi:DNA (cytosine-5-)-methyltransferase [Staphylococcus nepalensis]|nr:DNA (cytosine-5-)-methyltransferase [Staphylococcus nepalensis]